MIVMFMIMSVSLSLGCGRTNVEPWCYLQKKREQRGQQRSGQRAKRRKKGMVGLGRRMKQTVQGRKMVSEVNLVFLHLLFTCCKWLEWCKLWKVCILLEIQHGCMMFLGFIPCMLWSRLCLNINHEIWLYDLELLGSRGQSLKIKGFYRECKRSQYSIMLL